MAVGKITLTGDWSRLSSKLDPLSAGKALEREVAKATERNAQEVAKAFRQEIRAGTPPVLAPLTRRIKRSTKALFDHGELSKACVGVLINWRRAEAGVLRTAPEMVNVAKTLHYGASIKVTEKMRMMFARLAACSAGRANPATLTGRAAELWRRNPKMKWRRLSDSTKVIKIHGRPWMKNALERPALVAKLKTNWQRAVAKVFTG